MGKNQNVRWVFPSPTAATDSKYKVKIFLPAGLSCTQQQPCTMQWLFMTGNSPNSYPEAFRNCADFKLSSSATVEPEPQPELEPTTTTIVPPRHALTLSPISAVVAWPPTRSAMPSRSLGATSGLHTLGAATSVVFPRHGHQTCAEAKTDLQSLAGCAEVLGSEARMPR